MTDPSFTPESERELLAVFPDLVHAEDASRDLRAAGIGDAEVRLDDDLDAVSSLRAEMHDELTRAWVVPNAGVVYPAGAARGLVIGAAVAVVLSLVAALPLALIDLGSTYWVRWLVFATVIAAFGLTVALVVGPAGGAPRPGELPTAARGVVLHVSRDTVAAREALLRNDPLRVDEVSREGNPIATLTHERSDTASETIKDISANVGGDDYKPQR